MMSTRLDVPGAMQDSRAGARFALAGGFVGLCYAAISVYWGVGGALLLDTVGGSLESGGRAGDIGVMLLLWMAVVLKLVAVALPLIVVYRHRGARWQRLIGALAWTSGGILLLYGLVLTIVGLLVQVGVVAASATADQHALAWHAYLWDPWFLLWGLLTLVALHSVRRGDRNV
ncbi:DUF3995 domain-containing protein [Leekyejoonella antrihumi]|uniref:DUF3995 domain-containing protein n=1 Tax=Leekyejoonella antrihumi TaxID=1660198 RepID=A0A563DUA0_9MICO|nr:DUF3995 domain-containing protein [Leekyejoonella antrihumi]TWP33521.1 DUF3995 domain-containing protein [Leekyejoonella antrihumi]